MAKKANTQTVQAVRKTITKKELKEKIISKLASRGVSEPKSASAEQLYQATVQTVKEILVSDREKFKKRIKSFGVKKVYYLCMEFLVGRSLKNVAINLGIYAGLSEILTEFGSSFEDIYNCEVEPGLGNGGLGRLAA